MAALKANKKRKLGRAPESVDHAFFVCGKIRNKYIGQSSEYWLKAGGKSVWKYCDISWESKCLMLCSHPY